MQVLQNELISQVVKLLTAMHFRLFHCADAVSSVRFHAAVKQGYLWKRSSNVRKDWKRRFFFIRVSPLLYSL